MYWRNFYNKENTIPPPKTTRGLLCHFLNGATWPASSLPVQASSNAPVRSPLTTGDGERRYQSGGPIQGESMEEGTNGAGGTAGWAAHNGRDNVVMRGEG